MGGCNVSVYTKNKSFCGNRMEAARALEAKGRELEAAKARKIADEKKENASRAFAEALRLQEEAAMLEADRQWAAATVLQAWTRGVYTRRSIMELGRSRAMSGVDAVSYIYIYNFFFQYSNPIV